MQPSLTALRPPPQLLMTPLLPPCLLSGDGKNMADCLGFLTKGAPPRLFYGAEDPINGLAHTGQSTLLPGCTPSSCS